MKHVIKSMALVLTIMIFLSFPAFAREVKISIDTDGATQVQPVDVDIDVSSNRARISGSVRGEFLSDVLLEIRNPQNGNIGVLAVTSCYSPVDRVLMSIAVDQWVTDEDGEEYWTQVDYKVFEILPEDFEDGKLMDAVIDIEITGHEPGFYRLRSMHLVEKGDVSEFNQAQTEGIQITKRFPFNSPAATPQEAQ